MLDGIIFDGALHLTTSLAVAESPTQSLDDPGTPLAMQAPRAGHLPRVPSFADFGKIFSDMSSRFDDYNARSAPSSARSMSGVSIASTTLYAPLEVPIASCIVRYLVRHWLRMQL